MPAPRLAPVALLQMPGGDLAHVAAGAGPVAPERQQRGDLLPRNAEFSRTAKDGDSRNRRKRQKVFQQPLAPVFPAEGHRSPESGENICTGTGAAAAGDRRLAGARQPFSNNVPYGTLSRI